MTEEQRLVSQIREFLRTCSQEKTPALEDLSEQYAEVCRRANERLAKCGDFLDKGMRSEAVQEAQVPPALLPLVDTVNFQEVTKWRNVCTDLQVTVFPPLRLDIVDRLRKECTKEEFLSPLLKEYRRLVHQGSKDERIDILRRIRELDAANPVWTENLIPLEQERTEQLAASARQAIQAGDIDRLRELYEELTDSRRVVEAPKALVDKLDAVLRHHHAKAATAEGEKLVQAVTAVAARQDYEGLSRLLARWDRLAHYEDFRPSDAMLAAVAKAQSWHERETRRRNNEREFDEALTAVRAQLDSPVLNAPGLRSAWLKLEGYDRPVPDGLRQMVEDALERVRLFEARRSRWRTIKIGAAVLAGLVLLLAAAAVGGLAFLQKRTSEELRALLERQDYQAARAYLERLDRKWPMLARRPEIRQSRTEVEQALSAQSQQDADFGVVMSQLDDTRRKGFDLPEAQLRGLLAKAEQLALSPDAQTQLKSWRLAREMWQAKQQRDADEEFGRALAAVRLGLEERKRLPAGRMDAERKLLERLAELLHSATELSNRAGPGLRDQLAPVAAAIEEWQKDMDSRASAADAAEARRRRTLRAMDQALPDIEAYGDVLRGFVDEFADAPERPQLQRALDEVSIYLDAVALQGFRPGTVPPPQAKLDDIRQLLQKLPGGAASIWYTDLRACLSEAESSVALRQRLGELSKSEWLNLNVFYTRAQGRTAWEPVYFVGDILSREEKLPDGQPYTLYWGRAYTPSETDPVPLLEHRKWSSAEYEIKIQRSRGGNLVPPARFIRTLLAGLPEDEQLDAYLLRAIQQLAEDPEVDPIPKVELLRRLAGLVHEATGKSNRELAALCDAVSEPDPHVNWLNHRHPAVIELREKLQKQVQSLPLVAPIIAALKLDREILALALGRRLRCVGCIKPDDSGRKLVPALRQPDVTTVWTIGLDRATQKRQFTEVLLERGEDGRWDVPESQRRGLFAGQVLFAPADGLATGKALADILPTDAPLPLLWPESWPVNARQPLR